MMPQKQNFSCLKLSEVASYGKCSHNPIGSSLCWGFAAPPALSAARTKPCCDIPSREKSSGEFLSCCLMVSE